MFNNLIIEFIWSKHNTTFIMRLLQNNFYKNGAKVRFYYILIITLALLGASLWLIQATEVDREIQKYFFDSQAKAWLIDKNEPVKKFFFHKFPKIFLGIIITGLLVCLFLGFKRKSEPFFKNRHKILLIFLGLTLIPLTVGNIKKFTNIYCPSQLEDYGGNYPYVKIFDSYPQNFYQNKRGQCFPAGHATAGFALLILFFAFEKKSRKIFGLFSLIFYQFLKVKVLYCKNIQNLFCSS